MKQILPLALALLPCLAWAQYPSNGNQKITLGEQTSADGLIWRGVASDTTKTVKTDTSAWIVLDTANSIMYHYDSSSVGRKWLRVGGSISSDITGTLPVENGGTGATSLSPNNYLIRTNSSGIFDTSAVYEAGGNVGIGTSIPTVKLTISNNAVLPSAGAITGTLLWFIGNNSINNLNLYDSFNSTNIFVARRANGTSTTPSNLLNNETILTIQGRGYGSSLYSSGGRASITISTDEDWTDSNNGTRLTFNTTNNGTTTNNEKMTIKNNGNVGIGTTSPAVQFHTTSNVRFAGLVNYDPVETDADGDIIDGGASDFNLKNSIEPINYGLNSINQLKPVSYLWNDVNRKLDSTIPDIGFIAQDVMDVIPEAVRSNGDGDLQLNYKAITATLVKAIQEQQALIKALEQRIINLENK